MNTANPCTNTCTNPCTNTCNIYTTQYNPKQLIGQSAYMELCEERSKKLAKYKQNQKDNAINAEKSHTTLIQSMNADKTYNKQGFDEQGFDKNGCDKNGLFWGYTPEEIRKIAGLPPL